jgi:hypothetical protein
MSLTLNQHLAILIPSAFPDINQRADTNKELLPKNWTGALISIGT